MRGGKEHTRAAGPRLEQRVQFARGHWHREDQAGATRSAGWWESVTVTLSPAAAPSRPPSLVQRALATAVDTIVPALAEAAVASGWRLLDQRRRARAVLPSLRRQLPAGGRALPRPARDR